MRSLHVLGSLCELQLPPTVQKHPEPTLLVSVYDFVPAGPCDEHPGCVPPHASWQLGKAPAPFGMPQEELEAGEGDVWVSLLYLFTPSSDKRAITEGDLQNTISCFYLHPNVGIRVGHLVWIC